MRAVPEGLEALEELDVRGCGSLAVGSLRNAPTVCVLRVDSAGLRRVPEELTALEELDLSGFPGEITEGFFLALPATPNCARLLVLIAASADTSIVAVLGARIVVHVAAWAGERATACCVLFTTVDAWHGRTVHKNTV
ncbi:unnamed protein product [Pedinophyceae sp. YPF-701]|nr:unnamed protein product [Pedinophyceae sp. YPF-701]